MNIAFQMDDLSKLNFTTDSTIELILESQLRENNNYIYLPEDLFIENNQVYAEACKLTFKSKDITSYKCTPKNKIKLSDMKMIFIRQDPPYDMAYITSLHILELLDQKKN